MTGRGAALQGGLAALGLVAAYTTWQREPERTAGDVLVLDVSKNDLSAVAFEDEKGKVQLQRVKEDGEPAIWLTLEEKPRAPEATGGNKPPAGVVKPRREVRGQESALKLWDNFTPMRALRGLGVLDAAKLKELKLDEGKQRLTVTVKGAPREFTVAQPTGAPDYYLRDSRDGRVYVVPRALIGDLMNAQGFLVDRRLHVWKQSDFDGLTVKAAGRQRELLQLERDNPKGGKLAPLKNQARPDELAKNWHDKLWRVYVAEVLGKGETPSDLQPTPAVRLDYLERGKPVGWIELARGTAPAPPTSSEPTPPPVAAIYARTEHTAGWVKLGGEAAGVVSEAEKVVAGE